MMEVKFYRLEEAGTKNVGAITFRDGELTARGEDVVQDLLRHPLECFEPGLGPFQIDPDDEPERFMAELPRVFKGTYFWAVGE